jgi:hypothetical protein
MVDIAGWIWLFTLLGLFIVAISGLFRKDRETNNRG